jgi:F-box and leucine-rich repeat protein 2/20
MDYVCKNFDDLAPQIPKLTKELKDKLWKFMVQEKLLNDHRLPRFFDNHPIREIDLSGCDKISDTSIIYLSKKAPSLQIANLSFCNLITQEGIKHLCTNCSQLQTISLYSCHINDAALLHIASSLPTLKSLTIAGCNFITDNGISKLSQKCTELIFLDISHCKSISSSSIKSICGSLTNLQHFDLSWCSDSINDSAIQKLQKCHKLQHLGLAGINQITSRNSIPNKSLF